MTVALASALLLSLLGGCAPSAPSRERAEMDAYSQVMAGRTATPQEALDLCQTLTEPGLRGDCLVFLVSHARKGDALDPDEVCPLAQGQVWVDECYFVGAEAARRLGDGEKAAAYCLQAGLFKNDCGQHLWQNELRITFGSARDPKAPKSFEEALPGAQKVYERWAPRLVPGTDLESRFWGRFFHLGFEGQGVLDLEACAGLEPMDKERCEQVGVEMLITRAMERWHGVDPCQISDGLATVAGPWRVRPSPRLDAALREWQKENCPG